MMGGTGAIKGPPKNERSFMYLSHRKHRADPGVRRKGQTEGKWNSCICAYAAGPSFANVQNATPRCAQCIWQGLSLTM